MRLKSGLDRVAYLQHINCGINILITISATNIPSGWLRLTITETMRCCVCINRKSTLNIR